MTDPAATAANDLAITAPAQSSPATPVTADMPFDDALLAKNQRILAQQVHGSRCWVQSRDGRLGAGTNAEAADAVPQAWKTPR